MSPSKSALPWLCPFSRPDLAVDLNLFHFNKVLKLSISRSDSHVLRPCPVCDSTGPREVLHHQRFFEGPLGDGYDVVVCGNCGAGFADGVPTQRELDRYYADRSKYTYSHVGGEESPYDFRRFETIAKQLEPHLPSKDARILDIGCATGGLLAVLRRLGYSNVVGSDPSPACAEAARRLHGIEVHTLTLSEHSGWDERFDAVLLVGVLEHLREVRAAVRMAARLLRPSGVLYCAQPDVEAFTECDNAPFQQFSVEHVNFFSRDSLVRLMATEGLASRTVSNWMVEWREGMTDSVVSGIFFSGGSDMPRDHATRSALCSYLATSKGRDAKIVEVIEGLVRTQEPVLVWGAGTLTRRLLAATSLGMANIVAFVDSSPHLHGADLVGRKILMPAQIAERTERILICSVAFKREIVHTIREQIALSNGLIMFSDNE